MDELMQEIEKAVTEQREAHFEFFSDGKRFILSVKPVD